MRVNVVNGGIVSEKSDCPLLFSFFVVEKFSFSSTKALFSSFLIVGIFGSVGQFSKTAKITQKKQGGSLWAKPVL